MKLLFSLLLLAVSGNLVAQTVAMPTASPATGSYSSPQSISLSDTTSGAIICYTADGSMPAATSPGACSHGTTYSNPISVSSTTTIQAIGTLAGYVNSSALASTYTITNTAATVILCPNYSETGNYADCAPSPTLAFGDQGTGTASMAIPISVNNCSTSAVAACTGSGSVTLAGSPFTISGANSGDFTVSNGTCSPDQVLTAGEYCEPTITFTPTASAGTSETATLTVQDSGATTGSQTMALTGTGATVTTISSSSCPTNLTAGNYQLSADISCAGMAFTYTGNIDFNLNGYTITYGTASQSTQIGAIDAATNSVSLNAHNGTISHGAGTNSYFSTSNVYNRSSVLGFVGQSSGYYQGDQISASNLTINYNYQYANALQSDGGAMVVHDITINSAGVGNCSNPGCRSESQSYAIYQSNGPSSPTTQFYNMSQFGGPQGGITFSAPGAVVDYNYLNPGNSTGTNTNEFSVIVYGGGASVHNNLTLIPITANSESRGMIISGYAKNGGDNVYANYLGAFEQPDNTEYDGCEGGGTYALQFDDDPVNTNTASGNTGVATAAYACAATGLRVSASTLTTNISSGNSYTATRESDATTCVQGAWGDTNPGCAWGATFDATTGFTSENDTFKGDSADIYVSDDGAQGITFQSPTLLKGLNPSDFHTFGAQNGPLNQGTPQPALIHIVDATFGPGTSPTDAELASLSSGNAGPASFYIDWTQMVTVENGNTGLPISGASVTFTDTLGNTYPASGPCTTDVNGQCSVVVTEYRDNNDGAPTPAAEDRNPYSLVVSASGCPTNTQTGLAISGKTGYSVTLCAAATSITAVSGSGQTAVVGTSFANPLVVLVEDANNNPLSNTTVSFSGTGVSFPSGGAAVTNSSGEAEVTAEPTSAGSLTISASTSGASTSATFTETGTAGTPASVAGVSGSGQTAPVGSSFASPLVVIVKDSGSNPVPGATVTFAGTGVSFPSGATAVTNSSGMAMVTAQPATSGALTITASVAGVGTPASFSETGTGAPASITAVSGSGQSASTGTAFANPLVVIVKDASSNPVSNATVTFVGTNASFPSGATALTNSSGEAQATAEPTTTGAITITASVAGVSTPASFSETGTAGPVLSSITLTGTGPGTTVHLKAKATSPVVVTLSSSNPSVVTAPATVTVPTGASSAATGTLLGSLWAPADSGQTATLTATLNGVTKTLAVTLYSPSLHSFACSPATCPAVVGGQPYNFTVELSGTAPVGGGTVQITSSNPAVIPNQTVAIPAGQAEPATSPVSITTNSVTATATVTVTATFNGTTISVGPITVNPVTAVKSVTSDGASSPGTTVNLTAAAPTGGLVVQISSSNQTIASAPATVTVPAGQTTAEIGTLLGSLFGAAGTSQSATISATYNSITKSLAKTYTSPSISTFGCTTTPCPTVAGGHTISFDVTLSKSGAPVGGATVTITSDTPAVIPNQTVSIAVGQNSPAPTPVLINTNTVTANTVVHVTASYNGDTKNATGGAITVTPPLPPASIAAVSGSGQSVMVGTPFASPLVVLVEDENGNPVNNATVTFAGTGVSFPSGTTATTNSSGEAQVTAQPTSVGALTVTASVTGVSTPASFAETGISNIVPVAFGQANSCSASGTSMTCSYTVAVAAGELLVADALPQNTGGTAYTMSVSDNLNGAWTHGVECFSPFREQADFFYMPNSMAGSVTVTVTSSTSTSLHVEIAGYTGVAASNPVDVNGTCSAWTTGTSVTAPSVATTNANDLVLNMLGVHGTTGTVTASSPYTLRNANFGAAFADQSVSSTGTYTGTTFTSSFSNPAVAIAVAFKGAN